jgi:hypothetical protein
MNQNPLEKSPERIPNKVEVMEIISRFVENTTISRELSDAQGLYLLEAEVKGREEGEIIEYQYMRKGIHGKNQARETGICLTTYVNGVPAHSDMVLVYSPESNQWKDVR